MAIIMFIVISVIYGYRKGFFLSLSGLLSTITAAILSLKISPYLSAFTYNKFIDPMLKREITNILNNNHYLNPNEQVQTLLTNLPNFISNSLHNYNISTSDIANSLNSANYVNTTTILFRPIIINVIRSITFCILFLLFVSIFNQVINKLIRPIHIPIIGTIDSLIGACLGFITGVVLVLVLLKIVKFILASYYGIPIFFTNEILNHTYIFKNFYNFNIRLLKRA